MHTYIQTERQRDRHTDRHTDIRTYGSRTYGHTDIPTYGHTDIRTYGHTAIHPYIHRSIHPSIHTSMHPYIHPFIHTYLPYPILSYPILSYPILFYPFLLFKVPTVWKPIQGLIRNTLARDVGITLSALPVLPAGLRMPDSRSWLVKLRDGFNRQNKFQYHEWI